MQPTEMIARAVGLEPHELGLLLIAVAGLIVLLVPREWLERIERRGRRPMRD